MRKAGWRGVGGFLAVALLLCAAAGFAQGAEGLYEAGRKAFQDGLYPMASRNFQSLVEQYPDSALADDAEYLRGLADFYAGEYRRSIAVLSGLERKYPRSVNLRRVAYWLGAAHYHLGEDRTALGYLERQISGFPDEAFYVEHSLLLRAMALERLGRGAEAAEGLQQVLARPSAERFHAEALFRLGAVQLSGEQYVPALASFSRLVVEFPQSAFAEEARFYAAEAAFFAGRGAEAERRYRGLLAESARMSAAQQETVLYRLALILAERGAASEALGLVRDLKQRFPQGQYSTLVPRLEADLLFDLGRFPEATAAYRRALPLAGDAGQGVAYNLGLAAELAGDAAGAVEPLRRAATAGGEAGEKALFKLGSVLASLGRDAEAVAALQEFDARFPGSASREEALRLLAFVQRRSADPSQADEAYSRLLARYPSSPHRDEYLFARGTARLVAGDSAGALKDFFALGEQHPASSFAAEARYHVGYVYAQRGEYRRAIEHFEAALRSAEAAPPAARAELRGRTILAAGVCAYNAGDYAESIRFLSKNTGEGEPELWRAESWLYLGRAYYKLDRLEEAGRSFGAAAGLLEDPQHAEEGLFWQGLCEFRLNRLGPAKATFLEAARRFPAGSRTAESLYRAGLCAAQEKQFAESAGYYERALSALRSLRAPRAEAGYRSNLEQEILYQQGWSAFHLGERERALRSFEALARVNPDGGLAAEAFFKLAEEDFRAGDTRQALRGFVDVRERFPKDPAAVAALYWLGACSARLEEGERSLDYLLRYLESAPAGGALREQAVAEIRSVLKAQGSAAQGSRVLEEFSQRAEASAALPAELKNQVRYEYARVLLDQEPQKALRLLESLRGSGLQEPLRSQVAFLTGEYYRRAGDLARARDIFVGIVGASASESAASAQLGIARILESQNRRVEAAEEYLKAYFLYPDAKAAAQEGLFQAGRVYWELGNREKGRQLLDRLAAESPDSPWLASRPDR